MPGTMSRADLLVDYKSSLMDAAKSFTATDDADFVRHLNEAAADMHRIRPLTLVGEFTLVADQSNYVTPADLVCFKSPLWGKLPANLQPQPWQPTYPGPLPRIREFRVDGITTLVFSPAPSSKQIAVFGSQFRFFYEARHIVGSSDAETTINPADRHWLLLRAQASAMKELSLRDSVRPVQIGGGHGSGAKTGMPAALWESLMSSWLAAAE